MNWRRPKKKHPRPTDPINYPSGIAVETENATYFIKGKFRYKFYSERTLRSWGLTPVVGSMKSIGKIPYGGVLGFRDGTVIKNIADSKIYLISDNKLRQIINPDVFSQFGWNRNDIMEVSDSEAKLHKVGEVLT